MKEEIYLNDTHKTLKRLFKDSEIFSMDDMDKDNPYVIKELIDMDCYILNALLCAGDIFGGLPKGKRITFAGASSTGKSLLTAYAAKNYLKAVPDSHLIIFETEGASFYDMMKSIGLEHNRVSIIPTQSVEKFRSHIAKLLGSIKDTEAARLASIKVQQKKINELKKKVRDPEKIAKDILSCKDKIEKIGPKKEYILLLDSLGMLATEKEINDAMTENFKADFTRAKIIRSIFRIISMDIFKLQIPFLIVNHSYQTMDMYSPDEQSGGGGVKYASDVTLMLTKAKAKEGTEHIGAIISATVHKSRFMPENKKAKIMVMFKKGIQKYSYLLDLGLELDIIEKEGNSYVLNEIKMTKSNITKTPEKFFTAPGLQILRDGIKEKWSFGNSDEDVDLTDPEELEGIEDEDETIDS